ncbi:ATP-dependent DNA helicase RecG [Hyphomicrobium sp. 2TAF46]|uniref:ATP-dependent DNA helicase RecG n=1 Tax=Hyphomicrobium sp. 2TAF46 TaxID=3233019 RepID=UPI003F9245EB
MRPAFLNPLFASAQTLSGIGPRLILLLKKCLALPPGVSEPRVIDVLWHMPTGVIDRRSQPQLAAAVPGTIVTLELRVLKHKPSPRGNTKAPYKVTCEDDTGRIDLVFFHSEHKFIERQLPEGEIRFVSGRIERYGEKLQMTHPDYIVSPEARDDMPLLEPVYPLTAGLSGKIALKAARQAVGRVPELPEWQEPAWLEQRYWPKFNEAVVRVHRPGDAQDVSMGALPWQRLAYDEFLAGQLAFALVRRNLKTERGRRLTGDGKIRAKIADALPFSLTGSQKGALAEIADDLAAPHRMLRLLQGDVGSGKTVVALMTMAVAVEGGAQAALMAPTEVLARQHIETIAPLADAAGLRIALLTGREKGKARDAVISRLATGEIDILIGTHALFQSDVQFKDLAVAVIDEQHRFGVHQRMALQSKGSNGDTNVLVMTATPIPRTLLMTHYGDLDVSKLTEKPAGRKPIVTKAVPLELLERLIDRVRVQLAEGAQVYWVCPLIETSEVTDLAAAEERFAYLRQIFGDGVGLLHGGLSGKEKDETMAAFAAGHLKILVATTVIEVGVNVPNANIMVIEHAERFGLAQLHQLRGRVGRGTRESFCMLLYKAPLGETAEARLKMMEETEDGFRIAEKDLELRGGGEILGARQSGAPGFRIAEVPGRDALLEAARDDAELILQKDPNLVSERGQALRTLLYLFECDEAVRLFRAA